MSSVKTLIVMVLLCSLCAAADYQTATLLSITDRSSNRTIGNPNNVVTVTDVEYRVKVRLNDMEITGSYWPRARWSYAPTDFIANDPVKIRIEKDSMFVVRPNGKELKTKIVSRSRVASE